MQTVAGHTRGWAQCLDRGSILASESSHLQIRDQGLVARVRLEAGAAFFFFFFLSCSSVSGFISGFCLSSIQVT